MAERRLLQRAGASYTGSFTRGDMDGVGEYQHENGACYVGGVKRNTRHGRGAYTQSDGVVTREAVF